MNDYQELRKYLESLTDDDFIRFVGKLGSEIVIVNDCQDVYEVQDDPEEGGSRRLHPDTWRKKKSEELLACREQHPSEWNRICWAAQIDMDSAKQMALAIGAKRWATVAIFVSVISLAWQIILSCLRIGQ